MVTWNKIGFGTWPLSGDKNGSLSYGKTNDEDSKLALRTAFNLGINFYDTSDFYGFGHVESLMGDVFSNVRDEIVIVTKGGMISNGGQQNFSTEHLSLSLENSLKRLKTDCVDVYMLHSPPPEILQNNSIFDLLNKFKLDGKIKEFGVSLNSPNDGVFIINTYGIKIIEVNYNILDHRSDRNGLFNLCERENVKVICRTPLGQGILSGKFSFTDDKTDRRQSWSSDKVKTDTDKYKKLLSLLNVNEYTDSQNCLRFCLSNPAVSIVIPGMKTEDEVMENASVLQFPLLTENELNRIKSEYNSF